MRVCTVDGVAVAWLMRVTIVDEGLGYSTPLLEYSPHDGGFERNLKHSFYFGSLVSYDVLVNIALCSGV